MAKKTGVSDLNFEQAFEELQKVVTDLENEQHALEEALALFERGQELAKQCTVLLEKAELRVQQLTEEGELEEFKE